MVGDLKAKVNSLEQLLVMSRNTVDLLQNTLADMEASYNEKLREQDMQLRELENTLNESYQKATSDDTSVLDKQEIIQRLERMQQIAKTEARLEGRKVWTPAWVGDFRVCYCYPCSCRLSRLVILIVFFWH